MRRFVGDVHQFGDACLHPERQFVLADSRFNFRIMNAICFDSIHGCNAIDQIFLLRHRNTIGSIHVQDRTPRASKLDPLKLAWQKSRMPLSSSDGLALPELSGRNHDHKSRKILRLCPQTVQKPGAHGGSP